MRIKYLSKQDSNRLLEIIYESLSCSSEERAVGLVRDLADLLPYEAATSCITRLGPDNCIKSIKVVNVDYPSEYMYLLTEQGLMMEDPIVIEHFKSFQIQYWADTINRQPWSDTMFKIAGLADDFGFRRVWDGCGYSHGVRNMKQTEASFFCFHGLKRCPRTREILQLAVPHFHAVLQRLDNISKGKSQLTPKEMEVLKWVAQGKSNWTISVIMGISERTVKFHISNILMKLDAVTRSHAVAIAMNQGIFEIE